MKFDNNQDRYGIKRVMNNDLIKFLENKKLLDLFIDRVINCNYSDKVWKKDGFKINSVSAGFIWSSSPEGGDYWDKLNREYFKL